MAEPANLEVPSPALVTRTSGELLGKRPWPRVLTDRPLLFVLGPRDAGKTSVARRLLGTDALEMDREGLRHALNNAARFREWDPRLRQARTLLFEAVDCLHGRFGAIDFLGDLLQERAAAGRQTVLCQGADTSVTLLYGSVPIQIRATLLLRFPVGRGRRRYVAQRCEERGLDFLACRGAVTMEPWSYRLVEEFLDRADPRQDGMRAVGG